MEPQEQTTVFYDALAPMFDVMTDWETRLASEGPFLQEVLRRSGARRVLDAACGSGGHALALARWGYDVTGTDASQAMIALAQQKAGEAGLDVPFFVSDLAALGSRPGLEPSGGLLLDAAATDRLKPPIQGSDSRAEFARYDAVLCLGNSLPHLLTQGALITALQSTASVLRPGGLFITQNLNYDQRWVNRPRFFAAQGGILEGREVLVWRFADYDLSTGRIAFHIALFRKAEMAGGIVTWDVEVHTTPQRPLFHADLVSALTEAGFTDIRAYGRMATPFEPFDPGSSGDLVAVARTKR